MRNLLLGGSIGIGRAQATDKGGDAVDREIPSSTLTPQRPLSIHWLVHCGVLLIAVIAIGTVLMVNHFRDRALATTERELANTVLFLARHLDREFDEIELVQKDLVEHSIVKDQFARDLSAPYVRQAHACLADGQGRRVVSC